MREEDFEGTLILERLAELDWLEQFYNAVDSDDLARVESILKSAGIDSETISAVIKLIEEQ